VNCDEGGASVVGASVEGEGLSMIRLSLRGGRAFMEGR
jgi:hypothetical protein